MISLAVPVAAVLSVMMRPPDSPFPWSIFVLWGLAALGVVCLLHLGHVRFGERNGVARPRARTLMLTAAVAVSYLQTVLTAHLTGGSPVGWSWAAAFAAAAGAIVVMAAFALDEGRAVRWAVVGLVLVCTARAGLDLHLHRTEYRVRPDTEVAGPSGHPYGVPLSDTGLWTAAGAVGRGGEISPDRTGTDGARAGTATRQAHGGECGDASDGRPVPVHCRTAADLWAEYEADGPGSCRPGAPPEARTSCERDGSRPPAPMA
ncbi:hypothetical protein [Nocardiopsis sp. NPDC057823]|uniref:hypothetical protein n=1 Tax=Nocardiopsis sp. NPDC057823 TaxID=3346256 RepID=UPI00366CDB09